MKQTTYRSLVIEELNGRFSKTVKTRSIGDLPKNDLLIRVQYSSLNYKDALSATGNKGVTRRYPHTPGIDAVGTVVHSGSSKFRDGEAVIVTSYDLGMNTPGGFGQYISVPEAWAVKLPNEFSMKESMIFGTAGLTAGMCVFRLIEHIKPDDGKVVVSGATGGVGALSVAILAKLGFEISAISGKKTEFDFLRRLGASEMIARTDFEQENERPIMKGVYAGGIDTAGGSILDNMIKSLQPMGVVTCCGNVAAAKLNLTVFPFILRGVSLIGIDSQNYPMAYREVIWNKLAKDWKPDNLVDIYKEITLDELSDHIDLMLDGKLKGRTIVNMET
ncbi:YhdH/YhfP family quinone oxidoreductase [Candidatus Nitrotoga sp. M5]|uniref:YhdH/YhfP family quinone oxidoreductase n=1 Tax=Candidatus Nitrotoga sp. M5 TaxID=2890409 RepID=UPI001EF54A9D|nr:YhdH/YhfP family quinone oxidoreductase [Candidatus Nitrotoga sp. M5]CAH1388186.1 putative quinone oxidoreductase YhfP [Candidatus Nitrotoga sp. M5]